MSNNKIIISGLGSIGRRYIRILKENYPNFRIGILRSGNGNEYVEEKFAEKIFFDINDCLSWHPDYAIVSSPATLHLDQALFFAKENIPVIIEKPICTIDYEIKKMNELIKYSSEIPILVGYFLRHEKAFSKIKEWLDERIIGDPIRAHFEYGSWLPNWRKDIDFLNSVSAKRFLGGGVLYELSHELDCMLGIFGSSKIIGASFSNTGVFDIDVEDRASILAQTKNKVDVSIQIDFCTNPPFREVSIRGTKGSIIWNISKGLLYLNNGTNQSKNINEIYSPEQSFKKQLDHFFECCKGHSKVKVSVKDGLNVINLIKKIHSYQK